MLRFYINLRNGGIKKVPILRTMKTVYNSKTYEMKKIDYNIPLPV